MDQICPTCGTSNGRDASFCKTCGRGLHDDRISNHLWKAVIATLLFPIAGIVAVYYSARVGSRIAEGDREGAVEASRLARSWAVTTIGFVVGLMVLVLVMSVLSVAI